jgi:hypothetical protein
MMPLEDEIHKPLENASMLPHALAYARMGWEVLPCRVREEMVRGELKGAKSPLTRHGKDDATTDEEVIESWWRRWPEAIIGVRPLAGFVVLDVDPRSGGDRSLRRLLDRHGPLPETVVTRTGGGGLHIWLRCEKASRGKLAAGIDVKTRAGYVIAPPSGHESGGRYEWASLRPVAHAPGWVRRLLDPPPPRLRTIPRTGNDGLGLTRFVAGLQPGNRNNGLYWAARQAAEGGVLEALAPRLIAAAIQVGLSEFEAEATVRSAVRRIGAAA